MTDSLSVTTYVMDDRLPWLDDGLSRDVEGPFDPGILHDGGARSACAIRRISALGATLRGDVTKAPGDRVSVELASGQRQAATFDWIGGGEAGIRFIQRVDMLALINRKLISQPTERRAMPRVEIRCGVAVKWCGNLSLATLRNISARGLQLEGEGLPPRGTYVSLFVDGLNIPPGEVVWRKADLAGIELLDDLSWSSIMPWIREVGRNTGQ